MSDTPTAPEADTTSAPEGDETTQLEAPEAAALSAADLDDASPSPTDAGGRATRKLRQGVVVSDTNDKTIIVEIQRRTTHGLYGKTVKRTARLHAHDEANDAGVGDTVRITETRPLSRTKRWRLQEIIERAQ